jgi:hypothetical protein
MTEEVSKPEPVDYTKKDEQPTGPPKITEPQAYRIKKMLGEQNISDAEMTLMVEDICKDGHKTHYTELSKWEASEFITRLIGKGKTTEEPAQTPPKQEKPTNPTPKEAKVCEPTQETGIVSQETKANYLVLEEGLKVSQKLKNLITDYKLFSLINGKQYVRAEGWQLLGAMFGYSIQTQTYTMDAGEGYRSVVKLYDQAGKILSEATAICTRKEKNWQKRDDYALYSMAQTRALGKAYRMRFAWIMMMSGFEGTPAEEMEE